MSINRHNYEEFFILYLDNELSSEHRRQVELFVEQHPDLGEELQLLEQTRLETAGFGSRLQCVYGKWI